MISRYLLREYIVISAIWFAATAITPSVWMWEPILNETWYPADFAKNVVDILNEEYPYPYCYAGCDVTARGHEYFPIHFTHPMNGGGGAFNTENLDPKISYFTREWGR